MNFRLADQNDLPKLRQVYKKIIDHMNKNKIEIWDDIYPCEYFSEDIEKKRLYILTEEEDILAAFALCETNAGEAFAEWENQGAAALYLDRFGVNAAYVKQGIGSRMLREAVRIAREKGAEYLRLFVVDINKPAMCLYCRNGFQQVNGVYDEVIDENTVLHEYGFEIKTMV